MVGRNLWLPSIPFYMRGLKGKTIKSKSFSVVTISRATQRAISKIFYWSAMKNEFNTTLSQEHVFGKSYTTINLMWQPIQEYNTPKRWFLYCTGVILFHLKISYYNKLRLIKVKLFLTYVCKQSKSQLTLTTKVYKILLNAKLRLLISI